MWGAPGFKPRSFAFFFLRINDLPITTTLETKLFADDTHVSYAYDLLEKLETEANLELKKSRLPIKTPFKITWNNNEITFTTSVKYLSLWFKDNLKFDTHIKKLETDLAKYASVLQKIRNFLNINTLENSLLLSSILQIALRNNCLGNC